MSQENFITKGGEIQIKETKRGLEFHSFNFQRQRLIHIGTIIGQVYEKQANVLRNPEPSFTLSRSEFVAAVEHGAVYLRVLPPGGGTYSISLVDFNAKHESYYNAFYGPQMRCPLAEFQSINAVAIRNVMTDNPTTAQQSIEEWHQARMFG